MAMPQNYADLQSFLLNFTGSSDTLEIQSCISLAETRLRTIELPALRSNPDDPTNPSVLTVSDDGYTAPIPFDMFKPVLFFQNTAPNNASPAPPNVGSGLGPWIVYDRVSDREIITRRLLDQIYLRPYGILRVIRGKFSEVGQNFTFTPAPGAGAQLKAYYYRAWNYLDDGDNTTNEVINTFPEGYVYYALAEYYAKRKNMEEAQIWESKAQQAYLNVEDQYFKGKWSGGDTALVSNFQPRQTRYGFR